MLERVAQYRDQTERYMKGQLSEEEFRPLRLMNGLYVQTHAPMLRIAIPYGLLSAQQLRALANIADRYDRGYGHFTTRQNLQLNWVRLEEVPDLLGDLALAGMHAIQTSGNCIRNVTTTTWRVWLRTRSRTRAPGANCCANGPLFTRNSRFCRASSR